MKVIRLNITRGTGRGTNSKSAPLFFMLASIFFAISAMATTVHGGAQQHECFSTLWPHERSDLAPDPSVRFSRLENGFRYAVKENETPRDRVAMYLTIPVGSIHERQSERGYAHYLEHMLFNGTTHFPPGKLVEYFQSIGMKFGADINAYTSYDETVYTIVLPKGDIEEIEQGLVVMSDYARGALLLEAEVDRERGVILAEKLARDSIEYRTRVATRKNALRGTLLAERQPIGVRKTILSATGESLRAFYDRWYRPDNMTLVIVGDMQVEKVEKAIRRSFDDMKSRAAMPQCPGFGTLEKRGLHGFYYHESEAGNTRISIESHWNKKAEDDSYALQLRKLRHYIATSIVEKRLSKIAEEKVGLLSQPRVYAGDLVDRIGYAGLSATTSPDGWQDLVAVLENTLRQAITHGVRQEERDLMVQEVVAYYTSQSQKAKSRQSTRLARRMVRSINDNRVFQSPQQEEELFVEAAQSLTVEDINATLRRLFERSERLVEITGNVDIAAADPEQKIVQVYTQEQKQPVVSYVKREQAKFPFIEGAGEPAVPIRHVVHQDIDA
ncbi:MAG: M16 family metallopeptidase, partial [Desulfopila sp.]